MGPDGPLAISPCGAFVCPGANWAQTNVALKNVGSKNSLFATNYPINGKYIAITFIFHPGEHFVMTNS